MCGETFTAEAAGIVGVGGWVFGFLSSLILSPAAIKYPNVVGVAVRICDDLALRRQCLLKDLGCGHIPESLQCA